MDDAKNAQSLKLVSTEGEDADVADMEEHPLTDSSAPKNPYREGRKRTSGPSLVTEKRDPRMFVEAHLPFTMEHSLGVFEGVSFSLGGFSILEPEDGAALRRHFANGGQPVQLKIRLSGFLVELALVASLSSSQNSVEEQCIEFDITEIGFHEREALIRIMRAYLAGHVAAVDEVITPIDDPTLPEAPTSLEPTSAAKKQSRKRQFPALVAASIILVAISFLAGISIFESVFVVKSEYAAVTAPQIDFRSSQSGKLEMSAPPVGETVRRDELLYKVQSQSLEAEIQFAETTIEHLSHMARDEQRLESQDGLQDTSSSDDQLSNGLSLTTAPGAGVSSRRQLALAEGRLRSLKLKRLGAIDYAPCDCVVVWSQIDGSWVKEDDLILSLARTNPEDMRVSAIVPAEASNRLKKGDRAHVRLNGSAEYLRATVDAIIVNGDQTPRAGTLSDFLKAGENAAMVSLKLEEPIQPELIGAPSKVYFSNFKPLTFR